MHRIQKTFTIVSALAWLCACATEGNDVGLAATETTYRVDSISDELRQSAQPCATYHASELCLGFLFVEQPLTLAPGEEFACRLDFSACTKHEIRRWDLALIATENDTYRPQEYAFQLFERIDGLPVELEALSAWYHAESRLDDHDGVYINGGIPRESDWVIYVGRAPGTGHTPSESLMLIARGAIAER